LLRNSSVDCFVGALSPDDHCATSSSCLDFDGRRDSGKGAAKWCLTHPRDLRARLRNPVPEYEVSSTKVVRCVVQFVTQREKRFRRPLDTPKGSGGSSPGPRRPNHAKRIREIAAQSSELTRLLSRRFDSRGHPLASESNRFDAIEYSIDRARGDANGGLFA
jgi:hypothetical protein